MADFRQAPIYKEVSVQDTQWKQWFRDVSQILTAFNGLGTNSAALVTTTVTMADGVGAGAGTLLNAPTAGNPTKWIPINDNGTTRYIPTWT